MNNRYQTQAQRPQRSQNPFFAALDAAREIERKDADTTALRTAMAALDKDSQTRLVFRLQGEVLTGKAKVAGLFAAARIAHMLPVAVYTAMVNRAMNEGGLTHEDLLAVGLAEVKEAKNGKRYFVYRLSYERIADSLSAIRERNPRAAHVLANALRKHEAERTLRRHAKPSPTATETPDETESDPAVDKVLSAIGLDDEAETPAETAEAPTATETPAAGAEAVDYESMTVVRLRKEAAKRGIRLPKKAKKAEIISALKA